ncbi:hypothetical protein [Celeribacter arenosi]|uniref:Uncharacterized protein n=1 Tax=Celeribacter arenosi TaxID=792649 RepID=A0ABP7KIY7_9RHOB
MKRKSDTEIDDIVDELVDNESTAKALKKKLHNTFDEDAARYQSAKAKNADDDDLWDNMPV